jgi:hypothetical protein
MNVTMTIGRLAVWALLIASLCYLSRSTSISPNPDWQPFVGHVGTGDAFDPLVHVHNRGD